MNEEKELIKMLSKELGPKRAKSCTLIVSGLSTKNVLNWVCL